MKPPWPTFIILELGVAWLLVAAGTLIIILNFIIVPVSLD